MMEGRIAIVGLPLSVGLGSLEWGGAAIALQIISSPFHLPQPLFVRDRSPLPDLLVRRRRPLSYSMTAPVPADVLLLCKPQGIFLPACLEAVIANAVPFVLKKGPDGVATGEYTTNTAAVKLKFLGTEAKKEWVVVVVQENGFELPVLTTEGHPDSFLLLSDNSCPNGYEQAWFQCNPCLQRVEGLHFKLGETIAPVAGRQMGQPSDPMLIALQQNFAEQNRHFMMMEAESRKRTDAIVTQLAAQQQFFGAQQQEIKQFSEATRDMVYETKKDVRDKFADMEEKLERLQTQVVAAQEPTPLVVYLIRSETYVDISVGTPVKWFEKRGTHSVYITCGNDKIVCDAGYTYLNLSRNRYRAMSGVVDYPMIWDGHLALDEVEVDNKRSSPY